MSLAPDVLAAAAAGPASLDRYLVARAAELSPALAETLAAIGRDAMQRGELPLAFLAATCAARVHRALGDTPHALLARLDAATAEFGLAETPAEYDRARVSASEAAGEALAASGPLLAFALLALAADCAAWASTVAATTRARCTYLVQALHHLHEAADLGLFNAGAVRRAATAVQLDRFARVAAAVCASSLPLDYGDARPTVDEALTQVAEAVEQLVAVDFSVPGEVDTTAALAAGLATLSDEYGDPQVGARRRAFARRLRGGAA